ncbi:DUF819 family protein [Sulfurimonas sp.]|uniref:DUF819 family protein n=1 Tax=Sulfurimonas sp. TaxID=2022749 RepID=UPI0025CB9F05|nr:DUF819 family protein [Sulfurimonas sp.]MBT5934006.1 DUF819 domain-containing protein [Sulfurimonas sp.]
MISNPYIYLLTLAFIATALYSIETKLKFRVFKLVPAIVMIYASSMILATSGVFEFNEEVNSIYKLTKSNLLPAMLFLMLMRIDFKHFFKLGKSLLIAYVLAVLSLGIGFIVVAIIFNFSPEMSAAFGALAGSWMGGTANMIAVGSALGVSEEAFAYAFVVDSVNYTLWVMLLLFLVPFAKYFNKFTSSDTNLAYVSDIACACNMGAKRYWLLILLSLVASFLAQYISTIISILNTPTTTVIMATLLGIGASFTKLKDLNGSSEVATSMLYIIIALIGSKAVIQSFSGLGVYVGAGFSILAIHAAIMIVGAKVFKLDLFSIAVASLSNIGGVASAPILAATYNKNLVSVGVLMAIMGYIIGTFGGLLVGNILIGITS